MPQITKSIDKFGEKKDKYVNKLADMTPTKLNVTVTNENKIAKNMVANSVSGGLKSLVDKLEKENAIPAGSELAILARMVA